MKKLWYFGLMLTCSSLWAQEIRNSISLEGEWGFRIDSMDVGISEKWYSGSSESTIILPGSMAENRLGYDVTPETEWTGGIVDSSWFTADAYKIYRQPGNLKIPFWLKPVKHYKGPAWYQQEVVIPETWSGKRVILHLERPHWETTLFINDRLAGSQNSLAVPHEYDISSWVSPGKNRISIRVDNREIVPVGINAHSISDHTQSNWNGIVGNIYLEARNAISITDVQLFPEIGTNSARVAITLDNHTGTPFHGSLALQASSFNTDKTHQPASLTEPVSVSSARQKIEITYPLGKEALQWSEFSPALYRLHVRMISADGVPLDQQDVTFGMREFKAKGTRFQINGDPLFLRGTLECCIFPITGYPPTDQSSWEHVMIRCKEHGLNHIRFHSWCPPKAAFQAADKMGVYLQVECSSWVNQGSILGDGKSIDRFIYEEGDRIMDAYGNHPSFCMLAYGNEPGGTNQEKYLAELLNYWKEKDTRRVYTSAAGWPLLTENEYHNGPQPRIQQWGQGLQSIINAKPPQTSFDYHEIISAYDIPFVSHEIGQWCVYPDFKEMEKYTGVLKPTNFEIFKESLAAHHMAEQAEDFLMASGKLQALCYKAEVEAALRTPGFAGFQLLQLHDFPGQGTALVGILDPFFNSKGYITPEAFRKFCNQTVPLARMEKRIFTNSETFQAEIEMAHFGQDPLMDQTIHCQIRDASGTPIHEVVFQIDEIPVDNAISAGSIAFDLRHITEAGKFRLTVTIEDTPYSNGWDFWVYPQHKAADPGQVYITGNLDKKARKILSKGGSVLLLTHGQVGEGNGKDVKIGFSSIFWNTAWTRGQAPHTLGILCNPDHALFNNFPTEYHSNWQWWDPVTHSEAMVLDHLPADLRPLIQPIHTWFENRRLGLAFEAKAGTGKIMVCSIELQKKLEERPVSGQLLRSMLLYMNSPDFNPKTEVDLELIRKITGT
ncbi:MAG: sugar-binding domain-containing protein [Bacteroidota bacterium]